VKDKNQINLLGSETKIHSFVRETTELKEISVTGGRSASAGSCRSHLDVSSPKESGRAKESMDTSVDVYSQLTCF
jgi:hypothetical protein